MSQLLDKSLIDELERCRDLPSPPVVASKILELSVRPNSNIDTLAEIIHLDPSLSAKILGLANSSLYMRRVAADSVQQAVSMFGWTGTLNIALGFSVVGSIRSSMSQGLDYDFFWLRSIGAATAARLLGVERSYNDREMLFLAGLLQDIGILALDRLRDGLYLEIGESQCDHQSLIDREYEWLGVDHAAIGEWLLKTWRLPTEITSLVGCSHHVVSTAGSRDLQAQKCIYLSGLLADCICVPQQVAQHRRAFSAMQSVLDTGIDDFFDYIDQLCLQLQEMVNLFGVNLPDPAVIQQAPEAAREVLCA